MREKEKPVAPAEKPGAFNVNIVLTTEEGKSVSISADDPRGQMHAILAASNVKDVEIKCIKITVSEPVSYKLNLKKGA